MIVAGVDPALLKCAVAVLNGKELVYIGYVKSNPDDIQEFMLTNNIDAIYIEDQFYQYSVKTLKQLTQVRTMWTTICHLNAVKIIRNVYPAIWQNFIIGKFEKGKSKVASIEKSKQLGYETNDHNLSDAFLIAQFGVWTTV